MIDRVKQLEKKLAYQFSDDAFLALALTHRSKSKSNNERLEFLGDAVLGFVIGEALFRKFPDANEGQLSRLRARLVRKETLAELARAIDLGAYLQMGTGESRSGGRSRGSILADALEAVFGAVYLDGGFDAAKQLIMRSYQYLLDTLTTDAEQKDPKTRLQEMLQAAQHPLPEYTVERVEGQQHNQQFYVVCRVDAFDAVTRGHGISRRVAEQQSAERMLQKLNNEH